MHRSFLIVTSIHALLAWLFISVPQIDLWFSAYFFDPAWGFVLGSGSSRKALPYMPAIIALFINGSFLLLVVNWLRARKLGSSHYLLLPNRQVIFLLLALALGPGILVNGIFKTYWGRARPINVTEFGGKKQFSPAYMFANQCKGNCSFVSGDAAVGYFFLAFLFVAKKRERMVAILGTLLGTTIGMVRIAQGAHFLSDVVFAGFITLTVAWVLKLLLLENYKFERAALPKWVDGSGAQSVPRK